MLNASHSTLWKSDILELLTKLLLISVKKISTQSNQNFSLWLDFSVSEKFSMKLSANCQLTTQYWTGDWPLTNYYTSSTLLNTYFIYCLKKACTLLYIYGHSFDFTNGNDFEKN